MTRILIVEDEARITSFLQKGLGARGYATSAAPTGDEALAYLATVEFDLVILDLGLPDVNGMNVLRSLRERDRTLPVVVLTARDTLSETVAALEAGADDYVTKPFRFEELLARIRARLREDRGPESNTVVVGDAALDLRTRRLRVDGVDHELTAREFALTDLFFRHPGQVLSREQILSHVWGFDFDPGSNVVDVYVRYLRQKLGSDRIATVRGMGYRLDDRSGDRPSSRSDTSDG